MRHQIEMNVIREYAKATLPIPVIRGIKRGYFWWRRSPIGRVKFGSLKRLTPVSDCFGWDRGTPIDRYYLEGFLAKNSTYIRGRVLEVGDDRYTKLFGDSRVSQSDVIDIDATNPRANFIGNMEGPEVLPQETFDCIIVTQALHLLYDMRAGLATLHNALKPGGALLVTVPGISRIGANWVNSWYWSLTSLSMRRLLEERFQSANVSVEDHGNVFAATAFLFGLSVEELNRRNLDIHDGCYPVTVAACAIKGIPDANSG
jgi:hypothetical protein